mmetsp:Transcript_29918/g.69895  ORF Transcript_29918/g.69895 Transcript_29918/m.69895 type:complete len:200 (-) Transcript_29918:110-709(-)
MVLDICCFAESSAGSTIGAASLIASSTRGFRVVEVSLASFWAPGTRTSAAFLASGITTSAVNLAVGTTTSLTPISTPFHTMGATVETADTVPPTTLPTPSISFLSSPSSPGSSSSSPPWFMPGKLGNVMRGLTSSSFSSSLASSQPSTHSSNCVSTRMIPPSAPSPSSPRRARSPSSIAAPRNPFFDPPARIPLLPTRP